MQDELLASGGYDKQISLHSIAQKAITYRIDAHTNRFADLEHLFNDITDNTITCRIKALGIVFVAADAEPLIVSASSDGYVKVCVYLWDIANIKEIFWTYFHVLHNRSGRRLLTSSPEKKPRRLPWTLRLPVRM